MIIKLDFKIDIDELKKYLDFVQKFSPPFMKKNGPWGGWSITSSSGDVFDGWQTGEKAYSESSSEDEKKAIIDFFNKSDFSQPTPIYNEFIQNLIDQIHHEVPNLKLSRIRIAVLKPHPESEAYWHKDSDGSQVFRLHIPIITNDQCFFDYQNERHHLIADGSLYLLDVGKLHRAVNNSKFDRFHIIADAYLDKTK
jgi:hypothetical protein